MRELELETTNRYAPPSNNRHLAMISSQQDIAPTKHIQSLTVLRGIAAALVVFSHCIKVASGSYFGEPAGTALPFGLSEIGTFGVTLFFVLSGFTLFENYGNAPASDIGKFIVRRVFRIYPAFAGSIVAYLLVEAAITISVGWPDLPWIGDFGKHISSAAFLQYLSLTFNFTGNWFYINNVYWSLPIEFQFYLLFPVFALVLRLYPPALIVVALTLYLGSAACHASFLTLQLAWQFAGGMLVAWGARRVKRLPPDSILWLGPAAAIFLVLLTTSLGDRMPYIPGMGNLFMPQASAFYFGIAAIIVVFSVALIDRATTMHGAIWRLLVAQGESSYSLYLYHNLALLLCYPAIIEFRIVDWQRSALIYGFGVPVAYLVAWCSYRLIERPGNELGRRLIASPLARPTPASAQAAPASRPRTTA